MKKHTVKEFVNAGAYSANAFVQLVEPLVKELEKRHWIVTLGRSVVHIQVKPEMYSADASEQSKLKVYCHYKGRSRDVISFVGKDGQVLYDFRPNDSQEELLNWLHVWAHRKIEVERECWCGKKFLTKMINGYQIMEADCCAAHREEREERFRKSCEGGDEESEQRIA